MNSGKRDQPEGKLLEWRNGVKKKSGPVLAYRSLKDEGTAELRRQMAATGGADQEADWETAASPGPRRLPQR